MSKPFRSIGILVTIALYGWKSLAALDHSHRVKIVILRRESSLHTSLENRDSYLIQVEPKSGRVFTARMLDEYPGYVDRSPFFSFAEGTAFSVALRRSPYCDSESNEIGKDQDLRCFAVIHGSSKTPKTQVADEWWK